MNVIYWISGIVAAGVFIYLIWVLLNPEYFS